MNIKKKIIPIILIFFIIYSNILIGQVVVNAAEDTTPPTVNSVAINKNKCTSGDVLTVTVNAQDDISGIKYISIYYNSPAGNTQKGITLYTNSNGTYSGDIPIATYDSLGLWEVHKISLTDSAGNSTQVYNKESNPPYTNGIDLSSGNFQVEGTIPDTTPPTVNSVAINKNKCTSGDVLTVTVNAQDDISGIKYISIYYNSPAGNTQKGVTLYTNSNGTYSGDIPIATYDALGLWEVHKISLRDSAGNSTEVYNKESNPPYINGINLSSGNFQVKATTVGIIYNGNGSTAGIVPIDSNTYLQGETVTVFGNSGSLAKTGYSFEGWNIKADGSGTIYVPGVTFPIGTENVTMYAQWTINSSQGTVNNYTFTFDSQGGSVVTNTIADYNSLIIPPVAPIKKDYVFVNWYKEAGCINAWDFTTDKVTVNTTLYAKWTPKTPVENVQRLAGLNRIETSIAIAKEQYADKAPEAVVLATANDFADALAGSGLAYKYNAPLLLVNKTVSGSKKALDYITTSLSKDKNIYILGGTGVVSEEISDYLTKEGYTIIRLGGKDRYETNQIIVNHLNITKGTSIVITTGGSFADALSISSIADIKGYPILLNGKDNLSANVSDDITNIQPTTVYIIGGTGVISANIETQIKRLNGNITIVRLGGKDRYETSMKIIEYFNLNTDTITIATGIDFPDALSGSVLAARKKCSVLLIDNKDIIKQKELINKQKITNVIVFGGEGVISNAIVHSLIQR